MISCCSGQNRQLPIKIWWWSFLPRSIQSGKNAELFLATSSSCLKKKIKVLMVFELLGQVDIAYVPFIDGFQIFFAGIKNYDITKGRVHIRKFIEVIGITFPLTYFNRVSWLQNNVLQELNNIDAYTQTKQDPEVLLALTKKKFGVWVNFYTAIWSEILPTCVVGQLCWLVAIAALLAFLTDLWFLLQI